MLRQISRRFKLLTALEASLGALVSFILGCAIATHLHAGSPLIGGLWAMISAVIIEHAEYTEMLKNAQIRIAGTLIGVLISWLGFSLMGYSYAAFFICMLVSVIICATLQFSLYRLSCITIAIIFTVSQIGGYISPWTNGFSRLCESAVGIIVTLILASGVYFIRKKMA